MELSWTRCETEGEQGDPQDVNMEVPNIKAKPGKTAEEMDRRHNSRFWEALGPLGSQPRGSVDNVPDSH